MGMKRVLSSRLAWTAAGGLLLWVAADRAVDGLAQDPRFLAEPVWEDARGPAWGHDRGPAWGGDAVVAPILARLEALGPVNLFDPGFEARIRGALAAVPGVADVRAIRREWPDRYRVSVRLHRPAAVVVGVEQPFPVTADGRVLPYEPYAYAARRLLRITGVPGRAPAPGQVWRSAELADGLATVAQLAPHARAIAPLGLAVIDVAGASDPRRGVVVRGDDGITVRWGRPRAEVGENPVAKKVEYLAIAAEHLEQVRGFEIDVRWGTFYLRESPAQ